MWSLTGLLLSLAVAGVAWRRSRRNGGYYDAETYGMGRREHLRYALASAGFAAYFAATLALHAATAGVAGLTLYALLAVLYAASFLRGAADVDQ